MNYHTFVVGTSKSEAVDEYYRSIRNQRRFWETLADAGITADGDPISPHDYHRLGREYGIYLTEIVNPDEYIIASDSEIRPVHVRTGMRALLDRIKSHSPKRLVFVGKNAATWFYRYMEGKRVTHSKMSGHKKDRQDLSLGPLGWEYRGLDYWLLPNLHRGWNRDCWMAFWQQKQSADWLAEPHDDRDRD